jgi:hypothetical protein
VLDGMAIMNYNNLHMLLSASIYTACRIGWLRGVAEAVMLFVLHLSCCLVFYDLVSVLFC